MAPHGQLLARLVVAVEDAGAEVEALAQAGQEEWTAGIHVLLDDEEQFGVNAVHPLIGGQGMVGRRVEEGEGEEGKEEHLRGGQGQRRRRSEN